MISKGLKTNLVSFLVGLALFVGLLYWVRTTSVVAHLSQVGPWILAVILLYGIAQLSFTLAWWVLLDEEGRSVGLWKLARVYLAGYAVNYVVVSGNLAGEPLKAHLLKEQLPIVEGLSSVTINKLSEVVSMIVFQAVGIVIAFAYHLLTREMAVGSLVVFVVFSIAISLFFWRQRKGLFAWIFDGLARAGIARSFFEGISQKARTLDTRIASFYDTEGYRFLISLVFNLLGWFGGAIEGFFLLMLLGVEVSLPNVVVIEAISILADNMFFFIPARLGGSDGGKILIFLSMGMSSALGLSFGILKRAREAFYVAIGFLFLIQMDPFRKRIPKTF